MANSRFIRAMQTGELFQIGESSALAFDLSSACSLILNLLLIPPTPYLSILHQFPSLTPSPLPPPADSLSLSQCGLLGHTHISILGRTFINMHSLALSTAHYN